MKEIKRIIVAKITAILQVSDDEVDRIFEIKAQVREDIKNNLKYFCHADDVQLEIHDFVTDIGMNEEERKVNEGEKDCSTCANYTEFDQVDSGCYMCCKGLENNYEPMKGEEL